MGVDKWAWWSWYQTSLLYSVAPGQMKAEELEKMCREGISPFDYWGDFQYKSSPSTRRPTYFLTRNLNGIFPEIRVPCVVTSTHSPNRHQNQQRQGWKGLPGHPCSSSLTDGRLGTREGWWPAWVHWAAWGPILCSHQQGRIPPFVKWGGQVKC